MGKSGSYRQEVLNRASLVKMGNHEGRLDVLGKARSVEEIPPLVWSNGEIDEPENWSPDGWKSALVEDYERHVEGARRDKRAVASGKIAVHAFIQFPTDLELTPENERRMLSEAVKFTNEIHGGDAVFHARLDRDEQGKHGVDVFFAPRFEKVTGKKKDKRETWVSLTKFEKETAEKLGMTDAGPRARGRMFQDLWAEHLRENMGLKWAERGEAKETLLPDRLSPENFKLKKDREALDAERAAFDVEKKTFAAREEAIDDGIRAFSDGMISTRLHNEVGSGKPSGSRELVFSDFMVKHGRDKVFYEKNGKFINAIISVVSRLERVFKKLELSIEDRAKLLAPVLKKRARDDGMDL